VNGAEGYLVKGRVDAELLRAVDTIRQGNVFIPESLANEMSRSSPQA